MDENSTLYHPDIETFETALIEKEWRKFAIFQNKKVLLISVIYCIALDIYIDLSTVLLIGGELEVKIYKLNENGETDIWMYGIVLRYVCVMLMVFFLRMTYKEENNDKSTI